MQALLLSAVEAILEWPVLTLFLFSLLCRALGSLLKLYTKQSVFFSHLRTFPGSSFHAVVLILSLVSQFLWADYICKLCCVHVISRNSWFVSNNKKSQVSQRLCSPLVFTKRKKEHFPAMIFHTHVFYRYLERFFPNKNTFFKWRSVLVRHGKKMLFLFQVSMEKQTIVFVFSIWRDEF